MFFAETEGVRGDAFLPAITGASGLELRAPLG